MLAGAASLTFAAASAHGTGGQPAANRQVIEDLAFHQVNQLPILAADYKTGSCRGIPAGDDGWHFVFPDGVFVSVTAHFLVDGEVIVKVPVIRSDNPKQADVATPAGAKLVAASARGIFDTPGSHGNHESFNLSNTCPAGAPPVEPTEEPPPSAVHARKSVAGHGRRWTRTATAGHALAASRAPVPGADRLAGRHDVHPPGWLAG